MKTMKEYLERLGLLLERAGVEDTATLVIYAQEGSPAIIHVHDKAKHETWRENENQSSLLLIGSFTE